MIRNIPSADDLGGSAIELLVMAWDAAIGTFGLLAQSSMDEWDTDGSARADYHAAQQPALRHAHVWVHQAQELGVKARIAAVSPYILLVGDPRSWPKPAAGGDIEFNDFRTIDANDLVRVHDTVCDRRLPAAFVQKFEAARRSRNKIVHLGGRGVAADAREILLSVLDTAELFFPEHRWASYLMNAALNDPVAIAHDHGVEAGLLGNFGIVTEVLSPAMLRRHFGYDSRRRAYVCLNCSTDERDWQAPSRFAQLPSRGDDKLFCPVCTATHHVLRIGCVAPGCRSDVLWGSDYKIGTCLLCLAVDSDRFRDDARQWLRGQADATENEPSDHQVTADPPPTEAG